MSSKNSGRPSDFRKESDDVIEQNKFHEKKMRLYFFCREGERSMTENRNRLSWIVSLSHAEEVADHPEAGRFQLGLFPRVWQIMLNAGLEPYDRA